MMLALACAASVAAGVVMVVRALRPAPAPLAARLAALGASPVPPGTRAGLGRLLVENLDPHAERFGAIRADLAITDTDLGSHLAQRATTGALGAGMGAAAALVMRVGGVGLPLVALLVAAGAFGLAGAMVPSWLLASAASERRKEIRQALAGYVDLTGVVLAAGEGLETALRHAAAMGSGWAYGAISGCLESARLTRRPAWEALADLGGRLALPELVELADGLGLAGTEGSRLRESLSARAASLREHELSEAEAAAGSATEGMSAPLVAILAGFVALIGYPALAGVMGGLH